MKKFILCSALGLMLLNPLNSAFAADKARVNPEDISNSKNILSAVKIMNNT